MKVLIFALLLTLLFTGCPGLAAPDINTYYCKSDYTAKLSNYCMPDDTIPALFYNFSAEDVSYTELLIFLTDFKSDVIPSKACCYYAKELYNYSESQGIRCAIVIANSHAFNGFKTDGFMTYVDAGEGILSIATKDNDGLKFVKDWGDQVSTQRIGQEKDFLIFWEGEE